MYVTLQGPILVEPPVIVLKFQAKFSSEGLDVYVPGNGIRFETGVYLDLTTTDSVTIGYTG